MSCSFNAKIALWEECAEGVSAKHGKSFDIAEALPLEDSRENPERIFPPYHLTSFKHSSEPVVAFAVGSIEIPRLADGL